MLVSCKIARRGLTDCMCGLFCRLTQARSGVLGLHDPHSAHSCSTVPLGGMTRRLRAVAVDQAHSGAVWACYTDGSVQQVAIAAVREQVGSCRACRKPQLFTALPSYVAWDAPCKLPRPQHWPYRYMSTRYSTSRRANLPFPGVQAAHTDSRRDQLRVRSCRRAVARRCGRASTERQPWTRPSGA